MENYLPVFSNSEAPAKKTTIISSQNPVIVKSSPVQVNPEEVTDEFAPDASEDSIENVTESEPVKMETFSICDNNHWVHLFSDTDVNVECILTDGWCRCILEVSITSVSNTLKYKHKFYITPRFLY